MKLVPKRDWILARGVDVKSSRGASGSVLALPTNQPRNVTVLGMVDAVGPLVTEAKAGDLIVFLKCQHVYLRDGSHAMLIRNEDVITEVQGADGERLEIEKVTLAVASPEGPRA